MAKARTMRLTEAAEYAGESPETLRTLATTGSISFSKNGFRGHMRFLSTDLAGLRSKNRRRRAR